MDKDKLDIPIALLHILKEAYTKSCKRAEELLVLAKQNASNPSLGHNYDLLISKMKNNRRKEVQMLLDHPEFLGSKEGLLSYYFNNRVLDKWSDEIRVKLVLIQTGYWSKLPGFVQSLLTTYSHFGLHHAAIIVGKYLIDWHDHGIVTLRPIKSNAFLCMDVGVINKSDESLGNLCSVIAHWNRSKVYDRADANCQVFVLEALHSMGLADNIRNSLLNSLRDKGAQDVVLYDPHTGKGKKFESHEEFDEYVVRMYGDIQNNPRHNDIGDLLKAMDRAFWAANIEYKGSCPFDSPYSTNSFFKSAGISK